MKIKKILVSQPEPETSEKSPYQQLSEKINVKIDFRPFIHVEGVSAKDFRQSRIDILEHTAIIFSSKTAIDHFFRLCEELRITIPENMKYFCTSESVAFYLQKYIIYRKRKIFYGKVSINDIVDSLTKHKEDKYLVALSDTSKNDVAECLDKLKISYTKAIIYKTVYTDLSDMNESIDYDVIVFYSPAGVKSLIKNFPNFDQKEVKIASFGESTAKAITEAGLRLDIKAPVPQAPSMTMALEQYIKDFNKNYKK